MPGCRHRIDGLWVDHKPVDSYSPLQQWNILNGPFRVKIFPRMVAGTCTNAHLTLQKLHLIVDICPMKGYIITKSVKY